MSEHVLDWLSAYHDGELTDERRQWVAAHVSTCPTCQAELTALGELALRLRASPPMPARTPPDQFVAQVRLRLPPHSAPVPGRARVRRAAGLWLPLGVVALWALGQATVLITGLGLLVAAEFSGLPAGLPTLPGLEGLPLIAALLQPTGWGGWLTLLVLNAGLTAVAAALVWGSLAGWWAAREKSLASPR